MRADASGVARSNEAERCSRPSGCPSTTAQNNLQPSGTPRRPASSSSPRNAPSTQLPRPASTAASSAAMTPKAAPPYQYGTGQASTPEPSPDDDLSASP